MPCPNALLWNDMGTVLAMILTQLIKFIFYDNMCNPRNASFVYISRQRQRKKERDDDDDDDFIFWMNDKYISIEYF